ncbi:MAG: hypothetical protein KGZ82_08615 [Bacteroidales bacterium]|nr:hypothetical protein [Bacteroidales bacterium]
MTLITPSEIISLAYSESIEEALFKEDLIIATQDRFIRPIVSSCLFDDLLQNPASYATLINNFIKPCLAFYVKLMIYNQQIAQNVNLSSLSINLRNDILKDIYLIAKAREKSLRKHILNTGYVLYQTPTPRLINGLFIKS